MRPPFCTCAIAARKAPSDGMPAACRQNAAVTRKNAITPIERPPPGRGTPRAANAGCGKRRSRSACGTLGGRPRGARVDDRRTAGGYSQAKRRRSRSEKRGSGKTQRQAHGKKLRHAALPRGEPPSEAATRTVLRTVCAPARAFSDGTERWCGCRAKSHRGSILRATDAAQRRFSVAGITRTVCHNHTILWRK